MQKDKTQKRFDRSSRAKSANQKCELNVDGMHCAACEVLIEKKLLNEFENIDSVDASLADNKVIFYYDGDKPNLNKINKAFQKDNYLFKEKSLFEEDINRKTFHFTPEGNLQVNPELLKKNISMLGIVLGIVLLFTGIQDYLRKSGIEATGIEKLITPNAKWNIDAYMVVLITGLVAGFSSCAALVGGLLLSMSKQWNDIYSTGTKSVSVKSIPYFMFNVGRLISFPILGGLLGLLGETFSLSVEVNAIIIILVSLLMFALGSQMIGWQRFRGVVIRLPKRFGRIIANEKTFQGKWFPFISGASTFFLPCGFTTLAQAVALTSGDFFTGALIMFIFAFGTLPSLTMISAMSIYSGKSVKFGDFFSKVIGYLVLVFALTNLHNQFKLLRLPNFTYLERFYQMLELGIFTIILVTIIKLITYNIKAVRIAQGVFAKSWRVFLVIVYFLFFISFVLSYDLLLPWEYNFTSL